MQILFRAYHQHDDTAGQFLEMGAAEQVLHQPQHGYTRELLSAVPELPRA